MTNIDNDDGDNDENPVTEKVSEKGTESYKI